MRKTHDERWGQTWVFNGFRVGRLAVSAIVSRHRYAGSSPDRWVVQPSIVFDRKDRRP